MNYRTLSKYLLTGWLALCGVSHPSQTLAAGTDAIQPLLDQQTYAILVVNPDHFDIKASLSKALELMSKSGQDELRTAEMTNEVAATQATMEKWVRDFHQAGGRQVYLLANAVDGLQLLMAVSLAREGNRQAIEKLLEPVLQAPPFKGYDRQMKGDCLLLGSSNVLARILTGKPVARPDFSQALDSVAGCGIGLVVALVPDQKRVLQETLPKLSLGETQVSTFDLIKGVNWASFGVSLPPQTQLKMSFQTPGETDVKALNESMQLVFRGLPNLIEDQAVKRMVEGFFSKLNIQTGQNRLTFNLEAAPLEAVLMGELLPAMAQSKHKAQRIANMNNAKQILLGCRMYEDDNKKYPDSLKALIVKGGFLNANVLKTTDHPELEVGFEYLIPGKNNSKYPPGEHILIYEIHTAWPGQGLCVGFMDGHVELMKDQSRFDRILAASKARNEEK